MATPRTTATNNPAPADHWNSGSLEQRGLYALFEQLSHAAGVRAGRSGVVKNLADSIFGQHGASALSRAGATVAAGTLINADFFGDALANKLGLPRDRVVELANEGLDEFIRGTITGASLVDKSLPIEEQNQQLRRIAEEQFGVYTNKVAERNATLLREIIIAPVDGVVAWHTGTCPYKSPLVGREGVVKIKWFQRPKAMMRAACACQDNAFTGVGTLNEVFDHLKNDLRDEATVDEVLAVIATDAFKDVRAEFLARANQYNQVTIGMVERALKATDPAIRRGLFLELVGIQPKSGAEGAAAGAVGKVTKLVKDLRNPNSPIRQQFDTGVTTYVDASKRRRRAMNGKL